MARSNAAVKPLIETAAPRNPERAHKTPARAMPYAFERMKWLPDFLSNIIFHSPLAPTEKDGWAVMHFSTA